MKKIIFIIILLSSYISALDMATLPDDELVNYANEGDVDAQYQLGVILEELKYSKNNQRLDYIKRDSFYWYELAATKDHPRALTRIAVEYLSQYGHYKVKDLNKAIELLTKASVSDQEASLLLSILYFHGIGTKENKENSLNYFVDSQKDFYRLKPMLYLEKELVDMIRKLTANNDPYALFVLGDFYYYGKTEYYKQDYKKAFRIYKQAADLGNISSIYMVGLMYYNGIGVLKDLQESYIWISNAADAGIIQAVSKAGVMNYFGEGTEINFEIAHKLFSIAAQENDSLSQYFLGVMYLKGEGCEKNRDLAKKWIKDAYDNGSTSAKRFWETQELWK